MWSDGGAYCGATDELVTPRHARFSRQQPNTGIGSGYFLILAFIDYLMILFSIIVDLFWRDRRMPGLIKAIWVIFLISLSYVTALVYPTFEGRGWPFERAKPPVPPSVAKATAQVSGLELWQRYVGPTWDSLGAALSQLPVSEFSPGSAGAPASRLQLAAGAVAQRVTESLQFIGLRHFDEANNTFFYIDRRDFPF